MLDLSRESARAYWYRIFLVIIAILTVKGVVTEEEASYYGALVAAVLPTALAAKNTSTSQENDR